MKAFDPNYKLLDEMYQDNYYPAFLVDKVKDELQKVIDLLESGETDTEVVQETLDEAVCGINDLQDEFYENDSEIETVARDCIGVTVDYILKWFGIPIDMEEATWELYGVWEVDYPYWNDTYRAFCHVLTQMDAETADSILLDEMVYLIARDNEAEGFIQETTSHPQWFECLCRKAAASNESEAKWQFAAYLPECPCSQEVKDMILDFAKDPNEYVSRRALLAMPALRPDCVEQFAPLFWERNCYSLELQEYQRIAVLVSLDAIHSGLLPQYLEQAKQDGRRYLLEHAERIEGGLL